MAIDLFSGTSKYYSRFRVPYPETLFSQLLETVGVTGEGQLLDLGCGTGEIAVPLSPYFFNVTAVDRDPSMLTEAKLRARERGSKNIQWHLSYAEEFEAPTQSFELVTIGAAFHWMDRSQITKKCRNWLIPGKPVAILGSNSTWTGTEPWQECARNVLKKWLGEERRAGSGIFKKPEKKHEEILIQEGFKVEEFELRYTNVWTLDAFIGYLHSTSFASRAVLGDLAEDFENDMRKSLLNLNSRGRYEEDMVFYYILGHPTQQTETGENSL